jgi:hypothetical protein
MRRSGNVVKGRVEIFDCKEKILPDLDGVTRNTLDQEVQEKSCTSATRRVPSESKFQKQRLWSLSQERNIFFGVKNGGYYDASCFSFLKI